MAVDLLRHMLSVRDELRFRSTLKRVRALLDGQPVADSSAAVLIWEPRRLVPSYAVPVDDVQASLSATSDTADDAQTLPPEVAGGRSVLDPAIAFAAHTTAGTPMDIQIGGAVRKGAAFRLHDPDLEHLVILDFAAFDWLEEEEPIISHPRDPFSRIDIRRSSRHVRVELDGQVLAQSTRPSLLFEGMFPFPRYYLPRDDIRVELLPSETQTVCAYKGQAAHYSIRTGPSDGSDVAWSYGDPLSDARSVRGMVAFYQERADLIVDGKRQPRPRTRWTRRRSVPSE